MNQITDNLWVTDIDGVREQPTGRFNTIVTVCQDSVEDNIGGCAYYYFNMSDGEVDEWGGDDSYKLFEDAADTVYEALEHGDTVLVHCHHGQSRSVSVAAAVLAYRENMVFHEALGRVMDGRGTTVYPSDHLQDHGVRYVHGD